MTPTEKSKAINLAELRRRLASRSGREYWRSLEEAAGTPEFQEALQQEFPGQASEWIDPVGRRRFLQLMGASLALAGVTACTRQPRETILPYVEMPEQIVPGRPLRFATALTLGGYATGVLVESHMGRPTRIEGNPGHPASLGGTDAITQAEILNLYDPDRSKTVTHLGEIRPWGDLLSDLRTALEAQKEEASSGIRILTGSVTSPSLAWQIGRVLEAFPGARWHQYEPACRDASVAGTRLAFGSDLSVHYRLAGARVIVALESDLLGSGPASARHARDFSSSRRPESGTMSRLYVAESSPTPTGSLADHRIPLAPSRISVMAAALASEVGAVAHADTGTAAGDEILEWARAAARDLERHRGAGLVVVGESQPPEVQALVHALNVRLGNAGRTVLYTEPVEAQPELHLESLASLVGAMKGGDVRILLMLGGNPVYDAPADLGFAAALEGVPLRIHLGEHADETAALSHWHVPRAHELEAWGDARAADGMVTIQQPLIAPLYDGKTALELLAPFAGEPGRPAYEILRDYWRTRFTGPSFEARWSRALHDGVVSGSEAPELQPALRPGWEVEAAAGLRKILGTSRDGEGLEIAFRPDPAIHDGRFVNNGWLQELPRPLTKLTWENAALLSPATAERLGLASGDLVRLGAGDRLLEAPVWIVPGHAPDAVTVHLGYGRERTGKVGEGSGFNAYLLRTSAAPWNLAGGALQATGDRRDLACTQDHSSMEGRHLVRHADLEEYGHHPDFAQHVVHEPGPEMTLYPDEHSNKDGHAWGMAIDLNVCSGCNACMVACQSENNIPVVGREEVLRGREMHWIRIDRYFEGDLEDPGTHHQPVLCMHCENAPCEVVCPVAATVHSSEGLNDMVYNRCVGTRYCSNNCPYKVRRFNFFRYADWNTPSLKLQANPDVTVRSRGVMEKCTYCVQRINGARIEASKDDREIRDGEIVTACQQACPSQAIVFGDINDPESRVSKAKTDPRNYGILTELNTRPRTTYLASISNPNPELAGEHGAGGEAAGSGHKEGGA